MMKLDNLDVHISVYVCANIVRTSGPLNDAKVSGLKGWDTFGLSKISLQPCCEAWLPPRLAMSFLSNIVLVDATSIIRYHSHEQQYNCAMA